MTDAPSAPRRLTRGGWTRWGALVAFGIGFGYVEAAVVYYLRRILGDPVGEVQVVETYLDLGFISFVQTDSPVLVDAELMRAEIIREAATILMLAAVAWVAAKTWRRRLAAFFVAFTVWDLTYYLFLRVLTGWPASLADQDVFFLIPVPWVGPVATAVVLSTLFLIGASWIYLTAPATPQALRRRSRRA